jgi:hypothetical protein
MLTKQQRIARAHLATKTAKARRQPDDPEIAQQVVEARREFKAVSAEEYIRRIVEEAPPLSGEQLQRLRGLLPQPTDDVNGGGSHAA